MLPEVKAEIGGDVTVMLDGGFRRGSDVVKAMALGADAVLVGRATTYGLAAGGEAGVGHAIDILKTEIDRVMGLLGCDRFEQLDSTYLRAPGRRLAPVATRPGARKGALGRSSVARDDRPG